MSAPSSPPPANCSPAPARPGFLRRGVRRTAGVALALLLGGLGGWLAFEWSAAGRGPEPEPDAWQQARAALAADDLEPAKDHLRALLGQWPFHAEGHFLLARACRRSDDVAGWEEHLRTAEALQWPKEEAARERLYLRLQSGDVWGAEAELPAALDPSDPEAVLAVEALVKGDLAAYRLDDAVAWATGWIERRPDDWLPYLYRGRAYFQARSMPRAIADFEHVLGRRPDHPEARLRLADALMVERRFEPALAHYEAYRARRPDDAPALVGVANCRYSLGDAAGARAALDELFAREPEHAGGLYLRAQLALNGGAPEEALGLLRRADELAPHQTDVIASLALACRQLGRADDARRYEQRLEELRGRLDRLDRLRRQVRAEPDKPSPRYEAGVLCLEVGRDEEAGRWLLSVLRLAPDHRPTHRALAEHFEKLHDPRAAYHRARAEGP
jgi:tetratricopeptide (TPR) repeat protein